tara:strand:- start:4881 stop:5765 length:885 start_codon:yes stop_codon:yes gene_type:complete
MKTTSWPLNYPKSDEWPPHRAHPVVNSYASYPSSHLISRDLMLGYPLSKENSNYTRLQNSFFKSLRRLWTTIYRDDNFPFPLDSLNKMVDYCLKEFQNQMFSATREGQIQFLRNLTRARYLAEMETSNEYQELIDTNYPNAPFRENYAKPSPFSRFVLGKYPETLFPNLNLSEDWMVDFELEDIADVVVYTYDEAILIARDIFEIQICYLSTNWLSNKTGLPEIIFTHLQALQPQSQFEISIRALIDATCGFNELVDDMVNEGWENFEGLFSVSYEINEWNILGRTWIVGVESE